MLNRKIINNKYIKSFLILILSLNLAGCPVIGHYYSEHKKIKYMESLGLDPYTQYGLTYRIGKLGGVPVKLDEGFNVEYKDDMENINNFIPRTFDSPISSLGFEFRYTDEALLVYYHKAPRDIVYQYEEEKKKAGHKWLTVMVSQGGVGNYNDFTSTLTDEKYHSRTDYLFLYQPTYTKEFGLTKFVPSPKSKREKSKTYDFYLYHDEQGNVTRMIKCSNHFRPISQTCLLFYQHKLADYIDVRIDFQRIYLKDWQEIERKALDKISTLVVKLP